MVNVPSSDNFHLISALVAENENRARIIISRYFFIIVIVFGFYVKCHNISSDAKIHKTSDNSKYLREK